MKTRNLKPSLLVKWTVLLLVLGRLLSPVGALAGGTWTGLGAPDQIWLMLLLSNGNILCENNPTGDLGSGYGSDWYILIPDNQGSYANGTFVSAASANDSRHFFSSQVLPNGNVYAAGGEYGTGDSTAELFDSLANGGLGSWTYINPPTSIFNPTAPANNAFTDAQSMLLPDGTVLEAPIHGQTGSQTLIYNPTLNNWSNGAPSLAWQAEVSWVKLADGSILTVDPLNPGTGTNSERYIPSLGRWIPDANLPVQLWVNIAAANLVGETGPAFLLPNGKAFYLGGSGHTAIYTPSPLGGTNQGVWTQGPDIPDGLAGADAPGCMLPNGKILCEFAPLYYVDSGGLEINDGLVFYEYDYTEGPTGSFNLVSSPPSADEYAGYNTCMLALPNGQVLYSQVDQNEAFANDDTVLYIYTPDGSQLTAGQPVIKSITMNPDGSYHLVGTGLNGLSQGAAFGDDAQMDSNYPLVRFTDDDGRTLYGRTYNWSSTGVQTGTNLVTTEFTLPPLETGGGTLSLVVTANGISSDSVTIDGPVWVDFNYSPSSPQLGLYSAPFSTLAQGTDVVAQGGTISLKPGASSETPRIATAMTLKAVGGTVVIGRQ